MDLDSYSEERAKILESSQKFLTWEASLKADCWKLKEAIKLISLAYDDWKNGGGTFSAVMRLSRECIWDPALSSIEEYQKALFTLIEASIVARRIEALPIHEQSDYWIRPDDLLLLCQNKGVVLPSPYDNFLFNREIERIFNEGDLQFYKERYEQASRRTKKPLGIDIEKPSPPAARRDQIEMMRFLRSVGEIWAESIDERTGRHIDKATLLNLPAVKRLSLQLTDAKGSPAKYSDAYLKRKLSSVAPTEQARKPGRRKYAKS